MTITGEEPRLLLMLTPAELAARWGEIAERVALGEPVLLVTNHGQVVAQLRSPAAWLRLLEVATLLAPPPPQPGPGASLDDPTVRAMLAGLEPVGDGFADDLQWAKDQDVPEVPSDRWADEWGS